MVHHTQQEKYAAAAQEDRSAPRVKISIPAALRASGAKRFQTTVRDLSLSGFSATAVSRVHPGTYCWLTLPGMESLPAKVVWWENGLLGGAFETLLSPIILENILARWTGDGYPQPGE
ncbi:PilZ domain-containing protein [Novosphingobium mangrovi (ex Huang et al. 2023)]|uniref:PilZ domain-containing protein n=1 Tax=Novosphingobium mangrovi (ex Huang et al. 2023) TaxID=2976432 RepID=A0ABT2I7W9_9SPHN|nr:PilZ domain-containing protein [Novosphingobium mangrovi (ex Huang et al. 2023)]MCT2400678.1 PilZ domain-containing protein [Novosphingobium mangrovi (ex Huang et al. 2023)]